MCASLFVASFPRDLVEGGTGCQGNGIALAHTCMFVHHSTCPHKHMTLLCNFKSNMQFHFTSPHLSSSGPLAQKAEAHLLALSAATRLASLQQFHPSTRLSFSTVHRHIVFGQPTFLLPSGVQVNAVSHLLFLSIRRICPTHFHRLNLTCSFFLY